MQVEDRRHREDAAHLQTRHRCNDVAAEQDRLYHHVLGQQEVHQETLHGLEAPNPPHPRLGHARGEKHGHGFVLHVRHRVLLVVGGWRAEPANRGATGVETTRTHLQRAQGQGGVLLSIPVRGRIGRCRISMDPFPRNSFENRSVREFPLGRSRRLNRVEGDSSIFPKTGYVSRRVFRCCKRRSSEENRESKRVIYLIKCIDREVDSMKFGSNSQVVLLEDSHSIISTHFYV